MADLRKSFTDFILEDEAGAAALEFTLVAIPLILVSFCVIQFMLMAHGVIVMKQAAYAAARSALVYECYPPSITNIASNLFSAFNSKGYCDENSGKPEDAARIALLPISASNGKSRARQNGTCAYPEALIKIMNKSAVRSGLKETLEEKACYAFEPKNVAVKVEWETQIGGFVITKGPPPVTATVQFKLPIMAPVRMIFSNGSRDDGTKFWAGEVKVTLL
jgi:hypothetical protein